MNIILNSQELFFNSWNPFLINCNIKGHSHVQISTWLLQSQSTGWPLPCLWWHIWHLHPVKYFGQAVSRPGDADEEVQGRQQMFWEPIKTEIRHCRGHILCPDHRLLCQEPEEISAKGMVQERRRVSEQRLRRQGRNSTLGKSRTCCYQTAACPAPGPGGHRSFYHSWATLCIWHQELTLEPQVLNNAEKDQSQQLHEKGLLS